MKNEHTLAQSLIHSMTVIVVACMIAGLGYLSLQEIQAWRKLADERERSARYFQCQNIASTTYTEKSDKWESITVKPNPEYTDTCLSYLQEQK